MIVRKSLLPISIAALLLGVCSPAEYQVNPPVAKEIPESEKEGYMRIIKDLRWDQLTSKEEWKRRFPDCLGGSSSTDTFIQDLRNSNRCSYSAGGIPIQPIWVRFGSNSGTTSNWMTTQVNFRFFDDSQSRALKASLAEKYDYTTDGYCSKYTCWDIQELLNFAGDIEAKPTPYTISLLDQVKIDTSDL